MIKINYQIGNIIDYAMDNHNVVATQGCNCWNRMGRGLAAEVAKRIPQAVKVDQQTIKGDKRKLGRFTKVQLSNGAMWLNAYTQFHWNRRMHKEPILPNGKPLLFNACAFRDVCILMKNEFGKSREYVFPLIGCGLAHGTWSDVEKIINEVFIDDGVQVTVLIHSTSQIPSGVTLTC